VGGNGAGNTTIQIFGVGADGQVGGGDDELLGSASSNGSGFFTVALSRSLVNGETIYPFDSGNGVTGNPVTVRSPLPIPTVNPIGAATLMLLLAGGLWWGVRRGRFNLQ